MPPEKPIKPSNKAEIPARTKLDKGPANEIIAKSLLGLDKFKEFTGTGFAHPNPATNKSIVPIGSKCAKGLKVSLPDIFAVGSPNL